MHHLADSLILIGEAPFCKVFPDENSENSDLRFTLIVIHCILFLVSLTIALSSSLAVFDVARSPKALSVNLLV